MELCEVPWTQRDVPETVTRKRLRYKLPFPALPNHWVSEGSLDFRRLRVRAAKSQNGVTRADSTSAPKVSDFDSRLAQEVSEVPDDAVAAKRAPSMRLKQNFCASLRSRLNVFIWATVSRSAFT